MWIGNIPEVGRTDSREIHVLSVSVSDVQRAMSDNEPDMAQGVQWKELQTLVDSVRNIAQSIIDGKQPAFQQMRAFKCNL